MSVKIDRIVAKMKAAKGFTPKPSEDEEMEEGSEENYGDMGKETAAEAVLSAVKSGSASELSSALTSFFDLCGSKEEE